MSIALQPPLLLPAKFTATIHGTRWLAALEKNRRIEKGVTMNRRRLDDLERRIGVLMPLPDDGPPVRVYVPNDGRNPESTILGDTGGPVVIYDPNVLP